MASVVEVFADTLERSGHTISQILLASVEIFRTFNSANQLQLSPRYRNERDRVGHRLLGKSHGLELRANS